ncbi:MAG: type II toxin-antitoxin system Phd/YefM family antitoxin [Geminicoccaceae bacterium]
MSQLTQITAREANQRFSELLSKVETEGQGFVVTKHGRPVARIVPVEPQKRELTPDQEAALERIMTVSWPLGISKLNRDELYDRY